MLLSKDIKILLCLTAFQCLLWSIYLVFIRPLLITPLTEQLIRALIRVSILGFTALWYIKFYKKDKLANYINKNNLRFALALGFFGCIVIFLFFLPTLHKFQFPLDFPAWFNWILGSPFTEELYFRCIVLKELLKRYNPVVSIVASSLLFLAFHMPQWIFTMSIGEFIQPAVMIFIYGILFSLLWVKSKSIFAALLPHCLNNFFYTATTLVR